MSSKSCVAISANLLFVFLGSSGPLSAFFVDSDSSTGRPKATIMSKFGIISSSVEAILVFWTGTLSDTLSDRFLLVFYEFTGTIVNRFLTNQNARSI